MWPIPTSTNQSSLFSELQSTAEVLYSLMHRDEGRYYEKGLYQSRPTNSKELEESPTPEQESEGGIDRVCGTSELETWGPMFQLFLLSWKEHVGLARPSHNKARHPQQEHLSQVAIQPLSKSLQWRRARHLSRQFVELLNSSYCQELLSHVLSTSLFFWFESIALDTRVHSEAQEAKLLYLLHDRPLHI